MNSSVLRLHSGHVWTGKFLKDFSLTVHDKRRLGIYVETGLKVAQKWMFSFLDIHYTAIDSTHFKGSISTRSQDLLHSHLIIVKGTGSCNLDALNVTFKQIYPRKVSTK